MMKLLAQVRAVLRTKHYSRRTEEAYVYWVQRYVRFHGVRHPAELGEREVARFLSDLAVRGRVAASTQNQALSALLFLHRDVLGRDVGELDQLVRAKRPARLPVVLSRAEVKAVLGRLGGTPWLVASLRRGRTGRRGASYGGTIFTRPWCSGRLLRRCVRPASTSAPVATR